MQERNKAYLVEGVGTFMLTFVGAGAILTNQATGGSVGLIGVAFAHAIALAIAVMVAARFSGGHINPAITFAVWLAGRMPLDRAAGYWLAQFAGAVAAGYLLLGFYGPDVVGAAHLGAPVLGRGVGFWTGVLIEAVLTLFLTYAVFGTAIDPKGPNHLAGLAIGLVLGFDILVGGPLTGAAVNPARAFGPALAGGFWANQLVYWIGPLIGAGAAGLAYNWGLMNTEDA
ncbi:MAG TPA: aquaporin [Limnochordia bacterium]|nr:aquaporin [Limnochordia bacterium]